ncbi:MAG: hypothetical protein IJS46_00285, partial [Kiritimatiellae bacterium]|nr:hypothetical protein [Kiritimatiellia bacterium]
LARRVRLAVSSASSAAAALAVAALVAFPPRHGGRGGAKAQGAGDTREALQMLMCDAAEAAETSVEVDWDCTDFDFADALLAWQEAPLAM